MKKVIVGMSGGVDSAVSAMLLKEQGYDVTGVTLKLWDAPPDGHVSRTCCSLDDTEDARAVAFSLDIPFYVLNMKDLFRERVIDYFADAYLAGETPNPCIACNRHLKFQALMEKAEAFGADFIATGHYARIEKDEHTGRFLLKKAVDPKKDQSYVLYMLSQAQLSHLLFPLGNLTKTDVRKKAGKASGHGHVAEKPDSQDICFVPDGDYAAFLEQYREIPEAPGDFVDGAGHVLGQHKGMHRYTVGQRKGLGLALSEPHYILAKNTIANTITLGTKMERGQSGLTARDMNWILFDQPPETFRAEAKIRYSAKAHPATIQPLPDGRCQVLFDLPQPDIAPGQAVVLYQEDLVIGGGVIDHAESHL